MSNDVRDLLAEARAELHRDRATFEQRVSAVLDQLTREKLHLADEWRRLLAARRRFLLVGKRLRSRWHVQHLAQQKELARKEVLQDRGAKRLADAASKLQAGQDRLKEMRSKLEQDAGTLRKERTELIAYRGRFEAARQDWEEQLQRRREEAQALEHRIEDLQSELVALEARRDTQSFSLAVTDLNRQKVA